MPLWPELRQALTIAMVGPTTAPHAGKQDWDTRGWRMILLSVQTMAITIPSELLQQTVLTAEGVRKFGVVRHTDRASDFSCDIVSSRTHATGNG